ncbi:UNVERIFIED_CONTAM: hypothetical protein GTU68_030668 [Idotea baltica]|nr:hypothetical protein [Idotea baltica]
MQTITFLFLDGLLNWGQNLIAFTILSRVSPLTYSVASASKRISVIIFSLLMIGNPVTLPNAFGMFLAIFGVLGYNKVDAIYFLAISHFKYTYIFFQPILFQSYYIFQLFIFQTFFSTTCHFYLIFLTSFISTFLFSSIYISNFFF